MEDRITMLRELIAQSERLIQETEELTAVHQANVEAAEALLREIHRRYQRTLLPPDPLPDYQPASAIKEQELVSVG